MVGYEEIEKTRKTATRGTTRMAHGHRRVQMNRDAQEQKRRSPTKMSTRAQSESNSKEPCESEHTQTIQEQAKKRQSKKTRITTQRSMAGPRQPSATTPLDMGVWIADTFHKRLVGHCRLGGGGGLDPWRGIPFGTKSARLVLRAMASKLGWASPTHAG